MSVAGWLTGALGLLIFGLLVEGPISELQRGIAIGASAAIVGVWILFALSRLP